MDPETVKNKNPLLNRLSTLLFYFCLFAFIVALAFPHNPAGNWYQQFMPFPSGGSVRDIHFVDSLVGFAVTDSSILKTTNSGDSWIVKQSGFYILNRVKFLNTNTGFASGGNNTLLKTVNSGENWSSITLPSIFPFDMSVVSQDSIWLVNTNSLTGGVFFTSNGGASWQNQLNLGSQNPNHVYFYNGRLGFISTGAGLYRTINSGVNWILSSGGAFLDMYFADSLTGWKNNGTATVFQKTTNGGLNWITYNLPPETGNILFSRIVSFDNVINDTIWGVGSTAITGSGNRGLIYKSTNSGQNWGYQLPDSININIFSYQHVQFVKPFVGWAYTGASGVHTVLGGDPVWYTGIQQISNNIPNDFELKQNYPNPFNPRTVIPYKVRSAGYLTITAYDMLGRESQKLVSSRHTAGEYEVDFMGKFSASGVYFYRMEITDDRSKQLYTETKKMLMVK